MATNVAPVRMVWYPGEMDRLLRTPGGPVGRYLNRIALRTAGAATDLARIKLKERSGHYASGFRVEVLPAPYPFGFKYTVVNRATGQDPKRAYSYASTIEFGSASHKISARNPAVKKLRFYWPDQGRWVTTTQVFHPGTHAYGILRAALIQAVATI